MNNIDHLYVVMAVEEQVDLEVWAVGISLIYKHRNKADPSENCKAFALLSAVGSDQTPKFTYHSSYCSGISINPDWEQRNKLSKRGKKAEEVYSDLPKPSAGPADSNSDEVRVGIFLLQHGFASNRLKHPNRAFSIIKAIAGDHPQRVKQVSVVQCMGADSTLHALDKAKLTTTGVGPGLFAVDSQGLAAEKDFSGTIISLVHQLHEIDCTPTISAWDGIITVGAICPLRTGDSYDVSPTYNAQANDHKRDWGKYHSTDATNYARVGKDTRREFKTYFRMVGGELRVSKSPTFDL